MNWDVIAGHWKQFRGKEQAWWSSLFNDRVGMVAGERFEQVGKIQERYGIRKIEAKKQVRQFSDHIKNGNSKRSA